MAALNRATDWEHGRTILKIGSLLIRHGYQDDPTWGIVDYYWNGKIFLTSARSYVMFYGEKHRLLEWHPYKKRWTYQVDGETKW